MGFCDDSVTVMIRTGDVVGTPFYLPPEVVRGSIPTWALPGGRNSFQLALVSAGAIPTRLEGVAALSVLLAP